MRTYKIHILLVILISLIGTSFSYSQTRLQDEPSLEMREAARETVDMWDYQLALTGEQEVLMEKKILEFDLKKEEILQSKMQEEAKTARLKAILVEEQKDMRDILTKPQFDRYLAVLEQQMDSRQQRQEEN